MGDNSTGVTAQDALNQSESGLSSPDFQNDSWTSIALQDVINAQIQFSDPLCGPTSSGASPLKIVSVAGGMAIQDTNIAANTASAAGSIVGADVASAIPIVGAVFSTVVGIFNIFAQHHAAAVQEENALACALVPAANNFFSALQQAVNDGTVDPSDAANALQQLPAEFKSQASPSYQNNPCNAMCEYSTVVEAICIYWAAQYQQLAASNAANAQDYAAQQSETALTPVSALVAASALTPVSAPAQVIATASSLPSPSVPASESTGTTSYGSPTAEVTTYSPYVAPAAVPASGSIMIGSTPIPTWALLLGAAALAWAVL
jgi:hypothetical protein